MPSPKRAIIFSEIGDRDVELQKYLFKRYDIQTDYFGKFDSRDAVMQGIKSYDFAIFLLKKLRPQTAYFLGVCDRSEIPTLVFLDESNAIDPILSNRLIAYLDFSNSSWMNSVSIEAAISNLNSIADFGKPLDQNQKVNAFDPIARKLAVISARLRHAKTEQEMTILVSEAFSSINVISRLNETLDGTSLRPDIVLWSSDIEYMIGNPVIFELKRGLPSKYDVEQLKKYLENSNSYTGIILTGVDVSIADKNSLKDVADAYTVGILSAADFVDQIAAVDLKSAILKAL